MSKVKEYLLNKHYQQWQEDNKKCFEEEQLAEFQKHKNKHQKHYLRQYRQDHKKEAKHYSKQWRQDNKEYLKQYRIDNKEHRAEWAKQYYKTSAGKASRKATSHNYRVLARGLTIAIIQSVYEDNIKKYGRLTCILCFKPIEFGKDSLEHLTPLSRGGSNDFNNLGIAHKTCNYKKHTMTLEEWFSY